MFSLNGTLKKSGSVGRWGTKQFIGMTLLQSPNTNETLYPRCLRHVYGTRPRQCVAYDYMGTTLYMLFTDQIQN